MMEGGASQAPRRKSLPGVAIAKRMRSPFSLTALIIAAMTTGKISVDPEFLASWPTLRMLVPSSVPRDQLLCLPEPLMPVKGFSWSRHARPYEAETSSRICITIRFWSIWVVAVPYRGANSYWLGATSLCL
jgi:hypothetical protein